MSYQPKTCTSGGGSTIPPRTGMVGTMEPPEGPRGNGGTSSYEHERYLGYGHSNDFGANAYNNDSGSDNDEDD